MLPDPPSRWDRHLLCSLILLFPSVETGGKAWLGSGHVSREDAAELLVWPPEVRHAGRPTVGGSRFDAVVRVPRLGPSAVRTGFPAAARNPSPGC